MKSEWFKEWFNTEEYLNVYQHRNEADAEQHINLILKNVKLSPNAKVLDMACGSGRHAIILSRKNYQVTAVDLSENLLRIAKDSANKENLKINFINSDIRNFNTSDKFDLVLNLFTSFGYFETDRENFGVLNKAYELLMSSGYFVLDFFNSEFLRNNLNEFSIEKFGNKEIIQHRQISGARVEKRIIIKTNGFKSEYEESVRMFTYAELSNELKNIGFDILNIFGDFFGNKFNSVTSPRVIFFCKK